MPEYSGRKAGVVTAVRVVDSKQTWDFAGRLRSLSANTWRALALSLLWGFRGWSLTRAWRLGRLDLTCCTEEFNNNQRHPTCKFTLRGELLSLGAFKEGEGDEPL